MKKFKEYEIVDASNVVGGSNQKFEVTSEIVNEGGETWAKFDFRWVQNANK